MIELLRKQGFQVQHHACLDIVPVAPESPNGLQSKQWAMDLDGFDHVIVISTNAAQHWLELVQNYWPQWPVGMHWWAMGETTQRALIDAGIDAARPKQGDTSEALLVDLLPLLKRHHKVLIIRGIGGRETLSQALKDAGATVSYAQCYERKMPALGPTCLTELDRFSPQAVMLQSGETLSNFDQLFSAQRWCDKKSIVLVLPSSRVATQAIQLGYKVSLTSGSASNQAMCDTLLQQSRLQQIQK